MKRTSLYSCAALLVLSLFGCVETELERAAEETDSQPSGEVESIEGQGEIMSANKSPSEILSIEEEAAEEPSGLVYGDKYPEVLAVKVRPSKNERLQFNVTLSSPYDSPERYADAWRVLDDQDNELGIRILGHDHASEQPFTRSQTIKIPSTTKWVFVEARDQSNGWSGQRYKVELP